MPQGWWTGWWAWALRSTGPTSAPPTPPAPAQGEPSNCNECRVEPADHAIGWSCGGLSTKVHQLVGGGGKPLVILLGPGQGGDSPMLPPLLGGLQVPRPGRGQPRARPDALLTGKACCSAAHRRRLVRRGIKVVIPQRADRIANRKRRGRAGGGAPAFDATAYRGRNVVERSSNTHKQWRGLATRFDKHMITYRGGHLVSAITTWLDAIGDMP